MLSMAMETKRKFFDSGNVTLSSSSLTGGSSRLVYNPFNWMTTGTGDAVFTGNSIFIRSMMLRGKIAGLNGSSPLSYAGPMTFYIYLIKARDQLNTGSLVESWTDYPTEVNAWFNGSTPSLWYANSSRCQIIYRKKIKYTPDAQSAVGFDGENYARAPKAIEFFCKKRINRMMYFRENITGGVDSGLFGRSMNYYWVIATDQALGYSDVLARLTVQSFTTYKDV